MIGFDRPEISYSHQGLEAKVEHVDHELSFQEFQLSLQRQFRQFIREFLQGEIFIYRNRLISNYNAGQYTLIVDFRDISRFKAELSEHISSKPNECLPIFEYAARQVVSESLVPTLNVNDVNPIQIQIIHFEKITSPRLLTADLVNKLVCVIGIVISQTKTAVKATKICLNCKNCHNRKMIAVASGYSSVMIPRTCDTEAVLGQEPCPIDPFIIDPDHSEYTDFQTIKLQEKPELVPTGEMPRHVRVSLEKYLVDRITPGNRIKIIGVLSTLSGNIKQETTGTLYIRGIGVQHEGDEEKIAVSTEEEANFSQFAQSGNVHQKICDAIAPQIFSHDTVKKALACQLFGGCHKTLPDFINLRGDINILLLGDPSVAKSQFLKYIEKMAPIGVYTSGKGSSAAGLTASVIKDVSSGGFHLEGGALVLGDNGIVCIDEFDKMNEIDRVAIHESMEQQTISISKAGIVTQLTSRCSILAAANPLFGRYDETLSCSENIDFQTTILSRFDLIFVLLDKQNRQKDEELANHIVKIHSKPDSSSTTSSTEIDNRFIFLKKYIRYARARCFPRMNETASTILKNYYVDVRQGARNRQIEEGIVAIPITVRQLEAIVRISESLAKMELKNEVREDHVEKAIQLFEESTLKAASTGQILIGEKAVQFGQSTKQAEKFIQQRVAINSTVAKQTLIKQANQIGNHEKECIEMAIKNLVDRGELKYFKGQRFLKRFAV